MPTSPAAMKEAACAHARARARAGVPAGRGPRRRRPGRSARNRRPARHRQRRWRPARQRRERRGPDRRAARRRAPRQQRASGATPDTALRPSVLALHGPPRLRRREAPATGDGGPIGVAGRAGAARPGAWHRPAARRSAPSAGPGRGLRRTPGSRRRARRSSGARRALSIETSDERGPCGRRLRIETPVGSTQAVMSARAATTSPHRAVIRGRVRARRRDPAAAPALARGDAHARRARRFVRRGGRRRARSHLAQEHSASGQPSCASYAMRRRWARHLGRHPGQNLRARRRLQASAVSTALERTAPEVHRATVRGGVAVIAAPFSRSISGAI